MLNQQKTGLFISEMRKEKNLTQKQLADIIGVSDKAVSRWETGRGMPDTSTMPELCKTLEININELLSGERLSTEDYHGKAEKIMVDLMKDSENMKADRRSGLIGLALGLVLLFVALLLVGVVSGTQLVWFIDAPSVVFVIGIQVIILAASGELRNFLRGFSLLFKSKKYSPDELIMLVPEVEYAITVAQKVLLIAGVMVSIIGFVTVMVLVWNDSINMIGPNLAVAVLSLFYSFLFVLILIPIKSRIHKII